MNIAAAATRNRTLIGAVLVLALIGGFLALNPGSSETSTIETEPGPAESVEGDEAEEAESPDPLLVNSDEAASDQATSDEPAPNDEASNETGPAEEPASVGTEPGAEAAAAVPATDEATPSDPAQPADSGAAAASPPPQTDTAAPAVVQAGPGRSTDAFESIRNRQDKFSRFGAVPSAQLNLGSLTETAGRADNGSSPEGQFRVACEYSHFGEDDPVIFPGQPGRSHLHMFFGNTLTNALTTEESLINTGGGTCSGFELNRSAYWTPALLDGKGNAVVPYSIILYYKTKFPGAVSPMPQGLQMIAGNFERESFDASHRLHWSCGGSGNAYNLTNRIPDCGGDYINATIQFPSCWDGVNLGATDFVSHLDFGDDNAPCPASHPVRLPRISILLYFSGTDSVDGWHLASDDTSGYNGPPGGTLHADWWGAWNDEAMNLWINGCMKASRNCSFGQTGTSIQLAGISDRDVYEGQKYLPIPG